MRFMHKSRLALAIGVSAAALTGCASGRSGNSLPPASFVGTEETASDQKYIIGALDQLNVFVWRNPELSVKTQVRPDGRITTPLITDMVAVGKTPAQLADEIRQALTQYIDDPRVSVMIDAFQGTFAQQIRVVGATEKPASRSPRQRGSAGRRCPGRRRSSPRRADRRYIG